MVPALLHARSGLGSLVALALVSGYASGCGAPPTPQIRSAVVKPTDSEVKVCKKFVERMAACSQGTLTESPNDATRCGTMLAGHDDRCHTAFDHLTDCVVGVTCAHLWQGACLANYSVSTAVCEGFLVPEAYNVLGMTTR